MKKMLKSTGQVCPFLSRRLIYLMLLLVSLFGGGSSAWADTTLFSFSLADSKVTEDALTEQTFSVTGGTLYSYFTTADTKSSSDHYGIKIGSSYSSSSGGKNYILATLDDALQTGDKITVVVWQNGTNNAATSDKNYAIGISESLGGEVRITNKITDGGKLEEKSFTTEITPEFVGKKTICFTRIAESVYLYSIVVTRSGSTPSPSTYTVTFNAGSYGTCGTSSLTEASAGAGVTLPSASANAGYTFRGWSTSSTPLSADAGVAGANYKPSADVTLYAYITENSPAFTTQPAASTTVTEGSISGTLSVVASYGNSFEWYQNTTQSTSGATKVGTEQNLTIPTTLTAGTYYFYCVAKNVSKTTQSNYATVNVTGGSAPTSGRIFSLSNITGPTNVSGTTKVDLNATFSGGSARIYNNKSSEVTMVQNNQVNLSASSSSYLELNLNTPLKLGDKISIEGGTSWFFSKNGSQKYTLSTPFTISSGDESNNLVGATTLYIYKKDSYTISSVKITRGPSTSIITYDKGANGTGVVVADEKVDGETIELSTSTFTRAGYTQVGWSTTDGGAQAYNLGGAYSADADITLYPRWAENANVYTLHYHANGGVGEDYTQVYDKNQNVRLLPCKFEPVNDNYEFAGWSVTGAEGPVKWPDQDGPKINTYGENPQLYAKWRNKNGYTVTYNMNGRSLNIPTAYNQTRLTYVNMPQLGIIDGYYFEGWYSDQACTAEVANNTALLDNVTIYAKWTQFTDYTYIPVAVTDNATTNAANLRTAIETANGQSASVRKVIYVPNGTYDFGSAVGPYINQHNITIVGESKEDVIIKNTLSTGNSSTCYTLGVGDVRNVYIENLTVQNAYDYLSKSGIACAFYDRGQNTIIKNLKLLSYQDTYTTARGQAMRYVLDCEIHGIVDFICGEGKILFDRCTIVAESDNGTEGHGNATLTASQSSNVYFDDYGIVFKDCTVDSHVNTISLGRAWDNQSMTAFINTTFTGTGSIISDRWTTLGMAEGKSAYKFYEYGSTGSVGNAATPASKILSFTDNQGTVINPNFETVLSAAEAATYTMTNIYPYWIAYNYYTITKDEPANGTINVYPTYVAAGDKVKAFAEPAEGYVKDAWNVYRTGNEASKVAVDANDMFVMPAYNTTVSASFVDDGTVGAADCETDYAVDFSQPISISAGKTRHITFNNKSKGDANYTNFYLIAKGNQTASESDNYMRLRADNWDDINNSTYRKMTVNSVEMGNDNDNSTGQRNWSNFRNDMKDNPVVDMYVSYNGSKFYVNASWTINSRTYKLTEETPAIVSAANPAYLFLTVNHAYLSNIKVDDETDAYAVTATAGENGSVGTLTNSIGMNVSNGTCVQAGEKINFSAEASDGYKFSNWTTNEGATVVTTANPYEATIAGPTTLTANFVTNATAVVAAPVINASNPSAVTITAEGGAKIYYTTNGTSDPSSGKEYNGPFALTESTPIRAVASTDNAQTFSAETIENVHVNTDANVKLIGSASLSNATLKPYEWTIEGDYAGTYSLSCDDSGRKRALWSLFETDDAYKVSGNYQYHLTTPLGFKVTKIAIIGRSNSSSNNAYVTIDGQNIGDLKQSSPEVIKTLTYNVTNPEYGKVFNIQSDREMLINIELWGTMTSTVYTAEATSAQPGMGSASVSEAIVASGDEVTFYAQPEEGYAFVNWTNASDGSIVSTNEEYTTTASANLSLIANFRVAGSEDATLTSLSYNGINIPLVEDQYVYNVRALSSVMPVVIATASDANATINYTQAADYNGTATIEVVAEAGNVEAYTVNFTESSSVPETKVTWDFTGGDSQSAFTGTITSAGSDTAGNLYAMYVKGTGSDNYGKYIFFNGSRTIDFTGITGTGKLTIVTGNPSGTPADSYTITQGSETLATCSLAINSDNVSEALTYDASKVYTINIGKSLIKSITWTPYEIQNGKEITSAIVAGGKATISGDKITYVVPYAGQNGSTTIPVTLTLSDKATATATSPFPDTITSGTEFDVILGVESGTKVNSTVTVTAENSETQTYSVEILRGSMATSSVLYVETDGQDEYLTKEHIGNAKYASISYDGTGENTYDGVTGTYYDLKNSKKYIQITETGAKFYNVYVQHNNSTAKRKLALYVDGVKVKDIEVGPKVLNESGILPILADGTDDGANHTIKLVGAGSDVYPVKIKFYTTKQAASLTPAAVAIKMGKVTEDIAVTSSSGGVISFDETASAASAEYVTVSYSNGSLTLTPKKVGETTLYFDIAAAGAFNAKDNAEVHVTITKQDLTLTYTPSSYECNLDDEESTRPAWVQPTLVAKDEDGKTVTGLTYTYFSDDESIATVDGSGNITRKESYAVGSAGIYATFAGNDTYNDAQAVFTVKYVQGFTYQITDKTKFNDDKTNPAIREQIVLKDKENNPLVYATFGGWKRNNNIYHRPGATADRTDKWSKPVRYTGTQGNKPLYVDGFEFATSGADNACEETMDKTLPSTHEDYSKSGGYFRIPDAGGKYPFTLPVRGAYMTFEPTQNGKLTVYILQNGAFNSSVDADGNSNVIPGQFRKHSFYVADQDGNIYYEGSPYGGLTYVSKQNVSHYYQNTYPKDGTEWHLNNDGTQILNSSDAKVYDVDVNSKDVAKWPEFYQNYTANERKRISENWEDEVSGHGERQMVTVLDDGSHFLAMKAYAKYSIDVLGGQTYYIFSNRSKLGFCGMNFVPDTEDSHQTTAELTLADDKAYVAPTLVLSGSDNTSDGNNTVVKHGNVSIPQYKTITLNRTFSAGNWESICLPFTMTEKEVEDNFGVGTELIIMNSAYVEGTTLYLGFVYHEIQSILGGYPYLIKPTLKKADGTDIGDGTISSISVANKIIDKDTPQMPFSGTDYVFMGIPGYSTANVTSKSGKTGYSVMTKEGDVFLSGNTLYISQGTSVVKGYRAYIDFTGGISRAKAVALSFGNRWDEDSETSTSIESVMAEDIVEALGLGSASGVYNLNGQKIAKSAKGLPAGIYIINGNKTVIK